MKRPALDWMEREIIIWWNNNAPKNRIKRWWVKPLTVSRYEMMKSCKESKIEFLKCREIKKIIAFFFTAIDYINIKINKQP